jgi:hypothetical protein
MGPATSLQQAVTSKWMTPKTGPPLKENGGTRGEPLAERVCGNERLVDEAIAAVLKSVTYDLLKRPMDVAVGHRPEWVFGTFAFTEPPEQDLAAVALGPQAHGDQDRTLNLPFDRPQAALAIAAAEASHLAKKRCFASQPQAALHVSVTVSRESAAALEREV